MNWWQRLWRRARMEEQLDKELTFHLDQHTAELIDRGVEPGEARRRARLELGGSEQVKEQCRDARGTRWLEDALQDFRYAVRTMRQMPGFAAVAIGTLALGVGATTVMFTVINGVLLKPLAYPDPERLVALHERTDWATIYGNDWAFAYPNFVDCRRESRALDMAAWRYAGGIVSEPGEAEYADGFQISPDLFSILQTPLYQGRAFRPEEDRPGGAPVAIVSHRLWMRHFGGSAEAIGRPIVFDGKSYTVVGVAAPGFRLSDDADVFTPIGQNADASMQNRERHPGIQVWARLRPGARLTDAQAELAATGRHLAGEYPKSNAGRSFVAEALRPDVGDVGSTLWLLLGAVTLLLLIACANVASLLLARAASRNRELAMRAALGASRGRLVRQCLAESVVLGVCAGIVGAGLAGFGIRPFVVLWPGSLPRAGEVQLDWRVLLFTLAVSVASGLLFGLAPALQVPVRHLEEVLRAGGRTLRGNSRRLHGAFVVSEVALAVVLLMCAGVLGRTLLRLSSLSPGVDIRNVLVTRTALSPGVLANADRTRAAWEDVLDRVGGMAGVRAVAIVDTVPMREGNNQLGYWTSAAMPPANQQPVALATCVTPGYLDVMRMALRSGRFFNEHDRQGSQPVIVIDEVLARSAFGGADAVGRSLWIPDLHEGPIQVVGVVGHVRHWGLASDDQARVRAQVYYPFAQLPDRFVRRWSELMSIAVRTGVAPLNIVEPLRRAVRGTTGDQVVYEVRTMEELASGTMARQRFLLLLFSIFGVLALLLASIGIYGVLAYLTSRRVPEIGVRMALGASAAQVMQLVLGQSLVMVGIGVAVGSVAAFAAGRVLQRLVDGVTGIGPETFGGMIAVLVTAALVATYIPARRASRVDAMTALRSE
jgi:predicted permease